MSEHESGESKEINSTNLDDHEHEDAVISPDTGLDSFAFPKSPLYSTQVDSFITKVSQEQNFKVTKDARNAIKNLAHLFLMMTATVSSNYTKEHKHRQVVQKSDVKESLQLVGFGALTEKASNLGSKQNETYSGKGSTSFLNDQKEMKKPKISRSQPSSYCCFIKSEMPNLKKDFPTYRLGDLAKEASKRWKSLSAEEKAKFRN